MTMIDIIKSEERSLDNLYTIYLHLEGNFWRAYEWSAYLAHNFPSDLDETEKLNVIKSVLKSLDNYKYVKVGLQLKSFGKYFPKISKDSNEFSIEDKLIIIDCKSFFEDKDFSDYKGILETWKSNFKLKNYDKNKVNIPLSNEKQIVMNCDKSLIDLKKKIIEYQIENHTLIESIEFLSDIKNMIIKNGVNS